MIPVISGYITMELRFLHSDLKKINVVVQQPFKGFQLLMALRQQVPLVQ